MMKCPRCGHDVDKHEKYCPHCGLDLRGKNMPVSPKKRMKNYLIYLVIFFSMFSIPLFYSRILENIGNDIVEIKNDAMELPPVTQKEATSVIAYYDTLADFNKQFTNVSRSVSAIESFGETLSQKTGYTFDKNYMIIVYDNYNVSYSLKYSTKINEQLTLRIERFYDSAHTVQHEEVIIRKTGVTEFNDLFLNEEELSPFMNYVGDQKIVHQLMNDFKDRQDEFEQKKETLGHYGMGNYDGDSSFVVHRKGNTYYSELTYSYEPNDYIS